MISYSETGYFLDILQPPDAASDINFLPVEPDIPSPVTFPCLNLALDSSSSCHVFAHGNPYLPPKFVLDGLTIPSDITDEPESEIRGHLSTWTGCAAKRQLQEILLFPCIVLDQKFVFLFGEMHTNRTRKLLTWHYI